MTDFHHAADQARTAAKLTANPGFTFDFENFFHPYIGPLIERLNSRSLPGLFDPDFHKQLDQPFFTADYQLQPEFRTLWATDNIGQGSGAIGWLAGDFTGSRLSEIVQLWDNNGQLGLIVYGVDATGNIVYLTSNSGESSARLAFLAADFLGSGTTQMAHLFDNGGRLNVTVYFADSVGKFSFLNDLGPGTDAVSWLTGDFTGTGKAQIARVRTNANGSVAVVVYGTDTTGNFSVVAHSDDTGQAASAIAWLAGDFTGSGTFQLAQFQDNGGRLTLNLYAAVSGTIVASSFDLGPYKGVSQLITGDFTGSGRTQITRHYDDQAGGVELVTYGSDNTGRFTTLAHGTATAHGPSDIAWRAGDFTGSGCTELADFFDAGSGQMGLNVYGVDGTGTLVTLFTTQSVGARPGAQAWLTGDFTGIGRTEIALPYDNGSGRLALSLIGAEYLVTYQNKNIDVGRGPYGNYNWELLFHVPLTIAVHLSKNQRFAEAQRWFHYIFDPTCTDPVDPPQRFWKFLRFRYPDSVDPYDRIDKLVALLSTPDNRLSDSERKAKQAKLQDYAYVRAHPFQPHAVARTRVLAYQYSVVMKYLDNLIAWGDSLFAQDTAEAINEATQLYVLAANLLGPRPESVPSLGTAGAKSFKDLKAEGIGDVLVQLEGQFPFNSAQLSTTPPGGTAQSAPLFGIGQTLYFCLPRNDKLLGYWGTVADRLFKVRHCMTLEGAVWQLPLFDAPLDPGMLVKAAAHGIDTTAAAATAGQPVGPVRSTLLIQKALELATELRGLGGALLTALEKDDAEQLALLRQGHEIELLTLSKQVRFLQWKQTQEATQALLRSRATALERYRYYQRLLGLTPDAAQAPGALPTLDSTFELTEETFDDLYKTLVDQYDKTINLQIFPQLKLAGGTSPSIVAGADGTGNLYLTTNEDAELNVHLPEARDKRLQASVAEIAASVLTFVPELNINLEFWGIGATTGVFGGMKLSDAIKIGAEILRTISAYEQDQAGMAGRTAGYERRADEWLLQSNLAARELMQLGRQIIASLIAEQIARREHLNAEKQIAQSTEVGQFLRTKFTNQELYIWMKGEVARLYYEHYRLAVDTARKAEQTMKRELMRSELDATDFVAVTYWDAGRQGLLSGERLYLDLKRMELAYHDANKREFELTRHVSLRQLDPLALLTLKATGRCAFSIPEWLYDRDCPGHYMRRIKSVALSVPCVVGPYTSVNATLSLVSSTVRTSADLRQDAYASTGPDDDRFVTYSGSVQTVVTSEANNDSGMFETNLHDERFLPFERAGAVSDWRLSLPTELQSFDYSTISDAILHIRYNARDGGQNLGQHAIDELKKMLGSSPAGSPALRLPLLLSLPHDFPTEWATVSSGSGDLTLPLRTDQFPYLVQGQLAQGAALTIDGINLYTLTATTLDPPQPLTPLPATLASDLTTTGSAQLTIPRTLLRFDTRDLFMIIRYGI